MSKAASPAVPIGAHRFDATALGDLLAPALPVEPSWVLGYRQARAVRGAFGLPVTEALHLSELPVAATTGPASPDSGLQAVSVNADGLASVVLGWEAGAASKLFAAARGVWALRFDPAPFTLITAARSCRQRTSRAFAAELLAPAEGI
ncbi:MAG: hypothetical protein ACRDWV_02475 [Acidimicrobiales bacterium]